MAFISAPKNGSDTREAWPLENVLQAKNVGGISGKDLVDMS